MSDRFGPRRGLALAAAAAVLACGGPPQGEAPPDGEAERATAAVPPDPAPGTRAEELRERLRNRIEAAGVPAVLEASAVRVLSALALPDFYAARVYAPAWTGEEGPLPRAEELLGELDAADLDGLEPADYHAPDIRRLLTAVRGAAEGVDPGVRLELLVDLELLLTDAFFLYASHLLAGRVDAETLDPSWLPGSRVRELPETLAAAVAEGGSVRGTLQALRPPQPAYRALRQALVRYRALAEAGGWPEVPDGPRLERGSEGPRVAALRARLVSGGDLEPGAEGGGREPEGPADGPAAERWDEALETAVRSFQRRHGLEADGVVGPGTLAALNVPARERARQVRLNLERWRWLPEELGRRHVMVNVADFRLWAVEEDSVALEMRAIVGRPYRRTPVFSDAITYLVFSPYWHVPHGLAVQDQLPLQRQDPGYFSRVGMRVFRGWGADAREVDPSTVDWSAVTARDFPYRLRQDPGPENALGGVKFMFPNRFNVYLHDTPSRGLFARQARDFSSGCIRLEKPLELASWLLGNDARWTMERLRAAAGREREETVRLPRPVPVHLLYWTAFVEEGVVHFRRDIYGRDAPLAAALEQPPPDAAAAEEALRHLRGG